MVKFFNFFIITLRTDLNHIGLFLVSSVKANLQFEMLKPIVPKKQPTFVYTKRNLYLSRTNFIYDMWYIFGSYKKLKSENISTWSEELHFWPKIVKNCQKCYMFEAPSFGILKLMANMPKFLIMTVFMGCTTLIFNIYNLTFKN